MGLPLGCVLPHAVLAAQPHRTAEYFRAVEELGYDYVTGFDHVAGAPGKALAGLAFAPYTHADPFLELLVVLAHGAAVTSRIGLSTGVLVLPQRQTVLAAKQLATLSDLSQGRLRVGLGVGWNPAEFTALGVAFGSRGARLDEQVPLLRRLWGQETVTVRGTQHEWGPIGIAPQPRHRIPLWFGGAAEPSLRRVVAWGDGFVPSRADARTGGRPDITSLLARLRWLCDHAGRDPGEVGVEGRVEATGDDEAFAQAVDDWIALGASHLAVSLRPRLAPDLDIHLELLARCLRRLRSLAVAPVTLVCGSARGVDRT